MKRIALNSIYLLSIALILFPVSSLFAQNMLETKVDYAAGDGPISVFSIDFNSDGNNYLMTAKRYHFCAHGTDLLK